MIRLHLKGTWSPNGCQIWWWKQCNLLECWHHCQWKVDTSHQFLPPCWLDKIVPSWKSYGKSKLLRGPSVGTSVLGIGRSKASRSMLADGWCLCNVHRWHIGWWVGAKRCLVGRCKAHRTHLIILIYCKGRKLLPLKLSKVLKYCKLKGPNQMSPYGSITDISEPKELFS